MTRRVSGAAFLCVVGLTATMTFGSEEKQKPSRPNIVLFMPDDMSLSDIG